MENTTDGKLQWKSFSFDSFHLFPIRQQKLESRFWFQFFLDLCARVRKRNMRTKRSNHLETGYRNWKSWNIGQLNFSNIEIFISRQLQYCFCAKASFKALNCNAHQSVYVYGKFPHFNLNFPWILGKRLGVFCWNSKNMTVSQNFCPQITYIFSRPTLV